MWKILTCLLIIAAVFIGCETTTDDENPVSPEVIHYYNLSITGLPDDLTAIEGTQEALPFVVTVREKGDEVSDVEVEISKPEFVVILNSAETELSWLSI